MDQIAERKITVYDFKSSGSVDPDPDAPSMAYKRIRDNRFKEKDVAYRMCELLSDSDEISDYNPYENLFVPIKDIVRYWLNNIADLDAFLDEIMCDLYDHFSDKLEYGDETEEEVIKIDDFVEGIMEQYEYKMGISEK